MSEHGPNGHDPDPGAWHPEDLASAWVYTSPDAVGPGRGYDEGADREAGAGSHGPVIRAVEELELPPSRAPLVGRIAAHPGALTLLYGEPGVGKGWTSLSWAARVIAGGGRVLVLDYERNASEWQERAALLGIGAGGLYYVDGVLPSLPSLELDTTGFALVIIDSVLMSMGDVMGENEWSPRLPTMFAHAIEQWGCPVLGLAHQGARGGVFGSRYWSAEARMVWQLTHTPDDGRRVELVKYNGGPTGERYQVHVNSHEGVVQSVSETGVLTGGG